MAERNRIDEIVERIRANLAERRIPPRGESPREGLARFGSVRSAPELRDANSGWQIEARAPITSHRAGLGPVIVIAKRRFQSLVTRVLEGYLSAERRFFAAVVRALNRLAGDLERVARTAHADDQLVVERTDALVEGLERELRDLESRLEEVRERVGRAQGFSDRSVPSAPPARVLVGDPSRLEAYVPVLVGEGPVLHRGGRDRRLVDRLCAEGVEAELVDGLDDRPPGAAGAVVVTGTEADPDGGLAGLLREARRALRPNGLILVEGINPESYDGIVHLVSRGWRGTSVAELRFLLEGEGFVDVRVDVCGVPARDLDLPPVGDRSRVLSAHQDAIRRLEERIFAPAFHYAVGRRPEGE